LVPGGTPTSLAFTVALTSNVPLSFAAPLAKRHAREPTAMSNTTPVD